MTSMRWGLAVCTGLVVSVKVLCEGSRCINIPFFISTSFNLPSIAYFAVFALRVTIDNRVIDIA